MEFQEKKIDNPETYTCGDDNLMELSITQEANLASADVGLVSIISIISIIFVDMVCKQEEKKDSTVLPTSLGFAGIVLAAGFVLGNWHTCRGQLMGVNSSLKSVSKLNHFSNIVDVRLVLIIGIHIHISVLFFRILPMEPSKSFKSSFIASLYICSVICQLSAVIMQYRLSCRYSHSTRNMNDYTTAKATFLPSPWWFMVALFGFLMITVVNEKFELKDYRDSIISFVFAVIYSVIPACWVCFINEYNDTHCVKVEPLSKSDEYILTIFTCCLFLASIGFEIILLVNLNWGNKDYTISLICIIFAAILVFIAIVQRARYQQITKTSNSTDQANETNLDRTGI